MNPRRLYRCRQDRMIAGVAGGMAEYLEVDPTVVRILWLLSVLLGGFTILLYIVLAFIIPLEPAAGPMPAAGDPSATGDAADAPAGVATDDATRTGWTAPAGWVPPAPGHTTWAAPAHTTWAAPVHAPRSDDGRGGRAGVVVGTMLVVFGAIALAGVLVPGWIAAGLLVPAFVLALGIALLAGSIRRPATGS
jgi:phage shock protein C